MRAVTLAVLFIVARAGPAAAQAWVGPAGTGSISVAVQGINNTGHIGTDGTFLKTGESKNAAIYVEAEYAASDRLTLSVGLPYVFGKYTSAQPTPGGLRPVDECRCWNSDFQDLSLTARVNISNGLFGLTPFAAFGTPSHDYDFRGEAVVGRALTELRFGVAAGQRLEAVSLRLSIDGSYSYAIVQRVEDVPNNRSNIALGVAFAITEALGLKGSLLWQRTHGGLRTAGPPPDAGYPWGEITTAELFSQHDRLLRDDSFHAAFSFSYSLRNLDLFGSYIEYVNGSNTHGGRAFTGGVSWPFARN
ncbi:MAG: hypothetical protein ABIS06_21855 [Vicinamibacterales bacterium]